MTAKKRSLTREKVLVTALTLVRREGLSKLSMRKLAAELHVEAMALYNHVRDKDDLINGMLDLLLEEMEMPEDSPEWQGTLRSFAHTIYRTFVQYPSLMPAFLEYDDLSPRAVEGLGRVFAALDRAGLSPAAQVTAYRGLNALTVGFVMGHTHGLSASRPADSGQEEQLQAFPGLMSGPPSLLKIARYFTVRNAEAEFSRVVDLYLAGLVAGSPEAVRQ